MVSLILCFPSDQWPGVGASLENRANVLGLTKHGKHGWFYNEKFGNMRQFCKFKWTHWGLTNRNLGLSANENGGLTIKYYTHVVEVQPEKCAFVNHRGNLEAFRSFRVPLA